VHEDIVASPEGPRDSSVVVEGFGLAEIFVEAPVDPEVADSTKICDFLADLASKKQALMKPLLAPLEEIPVVAFVTPTEAIEGSQVDLDDLVTEKRNAFLSLVFRPLPLPILTTSGPRPIRAPLEVATTPRRSVHIEKQKRKEATTQEFLARTLGLLEKNAKFDDKALAIFNDKFRTPLSPWSITMLDSLMKKMEKVKKPKGRKVDAKKKKKKKNVTEIT
jgi:hypothetical protein